MTEPGDNVPTARAYATPMSRAAAPQPANLADILERVDAARTLFVVCSKTFTTLETLTNARASRAFLFLPHVAPHFAQKIA